MVSMRAYRADPHFAPLFDGVPVFCWPILWWSLNHLFRYCKRLGIPDVLYAVTPWGFIRVVHFGAPPDTAAYKPLPRTFRPLTDARYASDVPILLTNLAAHELLAAVALLPRFSGGGGIARSAMTEGALIFPILDST